MNKITEENERTQATLNAPFAFNTSYNGPVWYLTYNDIVMNAKLQLERPMSRDPVMPETQTNTL